VFSIPPLYVLWKKFNLKVPFIVVLELDKALSRKGVTVEMPFSFNKDLLDDPEFKEDSVREDIVAPLLRRLGYAAGTKNNMVRSRSLPHPFVYIGTKKHNVKIIPDYVLEPEYGGKWILDAKAPNEALHRGKNPEQAFSYAIHPEIRAMTYALCNGRELVVFKVNQINPVLSLPINDWEQNWGEILTHLCPTAFKDQNQRNIQPDYGLMLYKFGLPMGEVQEYRHLGVPGIARISDTEYSFFVSLLFEGVFHAASFDFDEKRYQQLLGCLPEEYAEKSRRYITNVYDKVLFVENPPQLHVIASVGKTVLSNEDEDYCPLRVLEFKKL
jgi:hypothetical protein